MKLTNIFKKKPAETKPLTPTSTTEAAALPSDRPMPSVNGRKKSNPLLKYLLWLIIGVFAGFALWKVNTQKPADKQKQEKREAEEAAKNSISGNLPALAAPDRPAPPPVADASKANKPADGKADQPAGVPPPAAPAAPPAPPAQPGKTGAGAGQQPNGAQAPKQPAKVEEKKPRSVFMTVGNLDDNTAASAVVAGRDAGTSGGSLTGGGNGNDELSKSLTPTRTKDAQAYMLGDRNYLLAKGAFLDCSLETRIDSTVPGMTSCILNRSVYSDNLKTVLLERGSKITGQYQGSLKQGQARIFVLWTRIVTPNGVAIDLDSPGTDALGASGHDGFVDNHFWERFGGAIMLSMIQDAGAALAGGNNSNTTSNTQNASQSMATEALRNTINIPPTLTKNQGEHINVYLARDLNFRSVYALRND